MFSRLLLSLVIFAGLLLALTGASAAQTATPPPLAAATPLPAEPTVNGFTIPRHVIYIGTQPGERNDLIIEGYQSDPLRQGLFYAFDFDGDGRFTEFGFPSAGSAPIYRAGPFTPALRVRDQAGRVAEQRFDMVARQFSAGYVDAGSQTWASLAAVGGRPALAYFDEDTGLKFAINSQADGGGAWTTSVALAQTDVLCPCPLAVLLGYPVIAYTDPATESAAVVINARADGSGEWRKQLVVGPTELAFPALLEAGNVAMMAFYQSSGYISLKGTTSLAEAQPSWNAPLPSFEAGGGIAGESSLALVGEAPGRPAIAYLREGAGLTYQVAATADLSGKWEKVTIPGTTSAFAPSLAMLSTGPGIAFRDYVTGQLKFAVAKTIDGVGEWTVSTVYPSARGRAPWIQQLALVDGRPAIAFESDKQGIVYAYNTEEDGSGQWSFVVLERPGNGGQNPTLGVAAGRPIVAYTAANRSGIKAAIAR